MKVKSMWVVLCIVGMSLMGVSQQGMAASARLTKIQSVGKIIVGMNVGYEPFEFKDKNGKLVGFDVDIAKELAKVLDVELEIKEYAFDDLIPRIGGDIDIIISGMTRTLDRAMIVNFTEPYFRTGQAIIVTEKNAHIEDWKELNDPKNKIAVVEGTTSQDLADKHLKAKIVRASTEAEAAKLLAENKVDALLYDRPYLDMLYASHPTWKVFKRQLNYELYCFAIASGDWEFLLWLNCFITELKLSNKYEQIYRDWFKGEPNLD